MNDKTTTAQEAKASLSIDGGTAEQDIMAAHVVRDGKILATVLIEPEMGGTYTTYRPGSKEDPIQNSSTEIEALRIADGYLAGFLAGYDQGREDRSST